MRKTSRGFSLVELMVAVTLASITGLVVLQVLSTYQTRKVTTSGHNDQEINAALGVYTLEREVRMAGSGITTPNGMFCNNGANIYYNGATVFNSTTLRPVQVIDGGAGPDTIQIVRSDSDFGSAPTTIVQTMATPTDDIVVDGTAALAASNLILVGSQDGSKICTLMQITQNPIPNGTSYKLTHPSATSLYNSPNPAASFATAMSYSVTDTVVNMGTLGLRAFAVVCNNGGLPTDSNNCDLGWYDRLAVPAPTLATVQSVVPQIIDMQVQYGVAPTGSQTVNQWVDATGVWAVPSAADQLRIKALRIALVARGNREGNMVAPAQLVLWDAGLPSQRVRALTNAERRFRYQVLTVIVPLVDVIWAGV